MHGDLCALDDESFDRLFETDLHLAAVAKSSLNFARNRAFIDENLLPLERLQISFFVE